MEGVVEQRDFFYYFEQLEKDLFETSINLWV